MLGLDIGERRIGVAVCDPDERVASPVTVLDASVLVRPAPLLTLAEEYEVGLVVVGLPLSLNGNEGPQAARVRQAGERIAEALGLPVEFADERLSSTQARRAMQAAGLSDKAKRGRVDMVAAALFLQSFLDARRDRSSADTSPASQGGLPIASEAPSDEVDGASD